MKINRMFNEFPVLHSEKLSLRKIEDANLQELFSIYSNPRVFEYCGILPKYNIETVKNMIGHFERDFNKMSRVKWGIFLKEEPDKMVGIIEAMDFNQKVDMVTIGYFLNESYWGKGITSEAVRVLLRFLLEGFEVNRIQAYVMPENNPSKKVLLKNDFIKEGLIRQASFWPGKGVVDLEIYSILKSDYKYD